MANDRPKIKAKETHAELASQFRDACNILRIDPISLIIICLYFEIVIKKLLLMPETLPDGQMATSATCNQSGYVAALSDHFLHNEQKIHLSFRKPGYIWNDG